MLPSVENWTTFREQFFEFFLDEMNDQVFDDDGLRSPTVTLRHDLLIAEEDLVP